LAEHVGEAEKCGGDEREANPVERAAGDIDGRRIVREQRESCRRQRHRNDTEEDPRPRLAVEQPTLKGGGDRRGGNDRTNCEQSLQDRLVALRIGEKNDRLPRHEQDPSGEPLHHAEHDEQVQSCRDGGNGAGHAHDQGRADEQTAWVDAVHQPGSGHEPDQLRSGISNIQPGELIGSCIGVADNIAAPE
jgi:hypothetical protein